MEERLKHLRGVHLLLILAACGTTYFSFAKNAEPTKLVYDLHRFMRGGPHEYTTFEEAAESLGKFPYIRRNLYRLSYRKIDDVPKIIAEIEGAEGGNFSVLGVQLVSTHTLTGGSLVQLVVLLYLYVLVLDTRKTLERGADLTLPVPWIGAMEHKLARVLVWSTISLAPTASSILAFLYFPSFLGIAVVSFPIGILGALAARESGRLTAMVRATQE